MAHQMQFRVLGPLEIVADGRPVKVDAPKQRAILAVLLIHANDVVSTDQLMEAVWAEEQPSGGPRTLRYHIFKLREALPADVIRTRAPGYVLEVSPQRVDALAFESLLAEARDIRATDRSGALKRLDEALGLWRGSAYADFTYDEFAHTAILSLHELQLRAMEDRFDICIELGREDEVIRELQRLVEEHPRRERLTGALMLALYRSGRQADALSVYQVLRRELGEGLGIEPSKEIQDLEERILLQDTSLDETTATPAAEFLRGYVLRGRIGEGAHGVVWRAGQPGVGREVAIKAIHPDISNRPGFVRRFEMEAQLVASLEHPHIVSLFDFWRDPDGAYLVMPYLRGGDLDHLLRQGPLSPDTVIELIRAIGGALAYAHRRGVIHRDVTPHNVLLDDEGHPYLADFGVATLIGETGTPISSSPAYLSPEQHAGKGAAPESDVYSLGVLTHAVLTGQAPIEGEQLRPVSSYRPDLVATVDEIIEVATSMDVAERYSSPEALVADLSRSLGAAAPVAAAPVVETRNPYKGLRAFAETDAGDFFGRDSLESELVEAVSRHRLVGVIGPSGCGKSSLVRAGLIPLLRRGVLPDSDKWLITDMYPGSQAFSELQAALLRVAVDLPERFGERLAGDAADRKALLGELLPPDTELLLIIDQFEELFTLTPDEDTRSRFLDALAEFAGDPLNRVRLVVTMRADFYDRPLEYPEFAELLRKGLVTIAVPGRDGLLKAVTGPAHRVGLEVEAGLAERITNDVAGQPGGLPLLEYALTELFQRRTESRLNLAGYEQTGGVLGALGRRAEDLYSGRDEAGQRVVQQVFLRLVTVEEGSADTRRRIPLAELRGMGLDPDALQQVLDDYGSHRLLTFDKDPDTRAPTVEVAHEALLTRWDRLRTWIDDRRDDLVLHRRLAASLTEWRDTGERPEYLLSGGRLEQFESFAGESDIALTAVESDYLAQSREHADQLGARRRRRRRAIMAGFGIAALIATVFAVVAFLSQRRAEDEAARAEANELAALEQRQAAEDSRAAAEQEAARAEREESVARARDLASSSVLAAESDPLLAMNLAVLAVETLPEGVEPGPALETALRTAKAADRSAGRYELDKSDWTTADLSPDGSTVAVVDGEQLLVVLDSATMEAELWSYRDPGSDIFENVAYSSDGEFIVVAVNDGRAHGQDASDADGDPDPRLLIFQADSGELVHTHPIDLEGACSAYISAGSWRSDLGLLGFGVDTCDLEGMAFQFVDTTTWEVVYEHPIPPNDLGFVYFGREDTLATMTSGWNAGPKSWLIDTADWSMVRELDYHTAVLSPDGSRLVGYNRDQLNVVVVEEAITGDVIDRHPTGNALVMDLRFSPEGDVLAIGTWADSTLLFDLVTGELMDTIQPVPVGTVALDENYLYVAGGGLVSKWDTTGIGLGYLNTVPLGLWVNANSIWWTSDGTVVAHVGDHNGEWTLYPVDPSTGDLGELIPCGDAWLAPIPGDRVVMSRFRESLSGVFEQGPLEVMDLSTGETTVIAGCWMEEQAALAREPCPNGQPHVAGMIAAQGSKDGIEFMIIDLQETEEGETEVFVSIWDSASLTETAQLSLGVQEGYWFHTSLLTEDYVMLHSGRNQALRVHDRATGQELLEVEASGIVVEHDRAQNRIWFTVGYDTEVWLLDLGTLESRPVTGYVADLIRGLATSPSGELVAVASAEGFVRIYTDEGELRHSIPLPNPSDAWWLDEENLVVGTGNGPWTVITLDADRLLGAVKDSLKRGFTDAECSLYEIDPCPTLEELRGD